MDKEFFVNALQRFVLDAAVDDTLTHLSAPAGRRISAEVKQRSQWFQSLSEEERKFAGQAIRFAAHSAVFGVLAVLDGVRVVDDEKGVFELFYIGEERVLINPPGTSLHEFIDTPE